MERSQDTDTRERESKDSQPTHSPQVSFDPRYSPRSSSLPKRLAKPGVGPRQTPQPTKIPWLIRAGAALLGMLLVGALSQSVAGKRGLRKVVRAIESGLRR